MRGPSLLVVLGMPEPLPHMGPAPVLWVPHVAQTVWPSSRCPILPPSPSLLRVPPWEVTPDSSSGDPLKSPGQDRVPKGRRSRDPSEQLCTCVRDQVEPQSIPVP